jgi:formylglycine-generating enzyme required for sulfatase activity
MLLAHVFIHHAPSDAPRAKSLARALELEGFGPPVIVSSDAEPAWIDGLRSGQSACRVLVEFVTKAWLEDPMTLQQTQAAHATGKAIIASMALDGPEITPEGSERLRWIQQHALLADAHDGGLRGVLRQVGAGAGPDPRVFAIDAEGAPYRGLAPFGDLDADAAVFFGRGRELVEILERLRRGRASSDSRALLVTGRPGVGKSSFVAAGILPRLRREIPSWTVVSFVRSSPEPLTELARAIAATRTDLGTPTSAETVLNDLLSAWPAGHPGIASRWTTLSEGLRTAAERPESTLLVAVDVDEALLENRSEQGEVFWAYLRGMVLGPPQTRLLLAVRSDQIEALRQRIGLEPRHFESHELRTLPSFRFDEVVGGPAQRFGLPVDVELVHGLMEDVPHRGGLRQLAFALEQVWASSPSGTGMAFERYLAAGRLAGILTAAPAEVLAHEDAPGTDTETAPSPASTPDDGKTARRRRWVAAALVALAATGIVLYANGSGRLAAEWRRLTVEEPFRNRHFAPYLLRPDQERRLTPGTVFRECERLCPEMVVVPAGRFLMGDEREADPTLLPRHWVDISHPFAVGRTEVTFEEYGACIRYGSCGPWPRDYRIPERSGPRSVVHLTRRNMHDYLAWLSRVTGQRYRLLSEAEWEYMARAGTTTAFFWGDEVRPNRAHCVRGCESPFRDDRDQDRGFLVASAPVASFPPNPFGVFDTHGNVWEVVQDCWHATYVGAPDDGSAWLEADGGDCSVTVVRGGGWQSVPSGIRSCARDWLPTGSEARPMVGFRVARDLAPTFGQL